MQSLTPRHQSVVLQIELRPWQRWPSGKSRKVASEAAVMIKMMMMNTSRHRANPAQLLVPSLVLLPLRLI